MIEIVQNKIAGKGSSEPYEIRIFHATGNIMWVEIVSESIFDVNEDGNRTLVRIQSFLTDITDKKNAELALIESGEQFRNIVNASPMGIHLYELEEEDRLVFVGANLASDALLGVPHEQFTGETIEEAFPALVDTEIPERYRNAAKDGAMWRTEQIDYNEGSINGAFELVAFQTEPGKMAVIFNEITQRKKAETALKESEERFRTLVEKSPLGISLIGEDGFYKYVNPQFEIMFGYTIEDIPTGRDWFKAAFPEKKYRRDVIDAWIIDQQHTKIGESRPREYTVTCKDGTCKEIDFRPVTMENLNQFVIYADMTERLRMEKQLQQAQKFEAIGTLAGGIAHDFNNLLMGIQGRASLMSFELPPSHPHSEHIGAIEEYIRSATGLTRQILGFARGGKYKIRPFEINELVLNSADMFGRTKKEIKIQTKLHNPSLVVTADRTQIEQVLLNLFVNAWQAMPDGGEIYIATRSVKLDAIYCRPYETKPGYYVKISLSDTGIGMDETIRQRIFDPFFTTKAKSRGTGLGLASAYGIIKNHGGMITVYSEPGHGTTFNIYLPASEKEAYRELNQEKKIVRGSETILLVDDEDMVIDVGKAMMEKVGYTVVVAKNGQQAIDMVLKTPDEIDVVVLDMIMPGVDGGKAFDRIREVKPELPVILSSGYSVDGRATEILNRGCNGFIQKPFNIIELSQIIRKTLDEGGTTAN